MIRMPCLPKLPTLIGCAAERMAKQDGVSFVQWIASTVVQKVSVTEMAHDSLHIAPRVAQQQR
jgi:hypothetical protein